jgi:hypothetical protein
MAFNRVRSTSQSARTSGATSANCSTNGHVPSEVGVRVPADLATGRRFVGKVKNAGRVNLAAVVTGLVRVVTAFCLASC